MPLPTPHTSTDSLEELPDVANGNDVAVAGFSYGADAPSPALPAEMWLADVSPDVQRQYNLAADTFNDLWPLARHTPAYHRGTGFWGPNQGIQLGWRPRVVTLSVEMFAHEATGIHDHRALMFHAPSNPQSPGASHRVLFNQQNWGPGAGGIVDAQPATITVRFLLNSFVVLVFPSTHFIASGSYEAVG